MGWKVAIMKTTERRNYKLTWRKVTNEERIGFYEIAVKQKSGLLNSDLNWVTVEKVAPESCVDGNGKSAIIPIKIHKRTK
jgi:hypothetical protein